MELIMKTRKERNKKGHFIYYGAFLCPYCLQKIERSMAQGKRDKSCGCKQYELTSKSKKGQKRTLEQRKNISDSLKGKKHTEERKIKNSISHKGKKRSKESRKKQSEAIKGKYVGKLSSNWKEGSSLESYPFEFFLIKNQIKERDLLICQAPGCIGIGYLCIHHIDYNKLNNNPENLITLCNSCHSKTNHRNNRQYWTEFYQNIMMAKIMECLL